MGRHVGDLVGVAPRLMMPWASTLFVSEAGDDMLERLDVIDE